MRRHSCRQDVAGETADRAGAHEGLAGRRRRVLGRPRRGSGQALQRLAREVVARAERWRSRRPADRTDRATVTARCRRSRVGSTRQRRAHRSDGCGRWHCRAAAVLLLSASACRSRLLLSRAVYDPTMATRCRAPSRRCAQDGGRRARRGGRSRLVADSERRSEQARSMSAPRRSTRRLPGVAQPGLLRAARARRDRDAAAAQGRDDQGGDRCWAQDRDLVAIRRGASRFTDASTCSARSICAGPPGGGIGAGAARSRDLPRGVRPHLPGSRGW